MTKTVEEKSLKPFFMSVIFFFLIFSSIINLFKYPYYSLIFKETGKTDKDTNILSLNLI